MKIEKNECLVDERWVVRDVKNLVWMLQWFSDTGRPMVYLSGKVTGLPMEEVRRKFDVQADILRLKGYGVYNPIDFVHPECSWEMAMRICMAVLPYADSIYMLADWEDSKGARVEYDLAVKLGIPVLEGFVGDGLLGDGGDFGGVGSGLPK